VTCGNINGLASVGARFELCKHPFDLSQQLSMVRSLPQRIVVVLAVFASLVRASYYLDDSDRSIAYMGAWYRSVGGVDITKLYNGTM